MVLFFSSGTAWLHMCHPTVGRDLDLMKVVILPGVQVEVRESQG